MANAIYDKGRQAILEGSIPWPTGDIRIALLAAGYTPDLANHAFVSDLGANVVARSTAITGGSATNGIANHSPKVISSVSGAQVTRYAYYLYNVLDSAARLICLIDTSVNLPMTPNGGDITVTADPGANKLFKL